MDLSNKVAIVTGGAKGIGLASAECMLRQGAEIMIVDWSEDAASAAVKSLTALSKGVDSVAADISSVADVEKAIQATVDRFGGIDVLVNNAGIQTFGDPVTTTEEVWDKTMNVNLKGHWLMSKYAIPEMLKRGKGSIVNVSSVQGLASQKNVVAYSTSKHAMIGLTRSMAVDMASRNVRVNCVCPGTVNTPMIQSIIELDSESRQTEKYSRQNAPSGAHRATIGNRRSNRVSGQ